MADYMTDPLEILRMQAQEQAAPTGIMGFLRNPAVRAALMGASQGFAQAAQSGQPGAGYALSQGLAGAAQGVGTWEEQQAKAAAERLKMLMDERRGGGVTDYRYQLDLIAKRIARDKGIPYDEALIEAQQEYAGRGLETQQAVAATRFDYAKQLAEENARLQRELESFKAGQAPSTAAAVAEAETKAKAGATRDVEREQEAEGAIVAEGILESISTDLAKLPSPAALKIEGAKAFFGFDNQEIQTALGNIATNNGLLIEYVKKLPGASTDREFPVFMASAGIAIDESKPAAQRIASARAAQKYFQGIQRRQEERMRKRQPAGSAPAPAPKPSGIRIDANGRIIK